MYTIGASVILFAGAVGALIFGPLCFITGGYVNFDHNDYFQHKSPIQKTAGITADSI